MAPRAALVVAVRHDLAVERRQLVGWSVAVAAVTGVVAAAIARLYPTLRARHTLVVLADVPAFRAILGPLVEWRTIAGITEWREGLLLVVGASLATTFLVVRRTRAEEQRGRTELVIAAGLTREGSVLAALFAACVLDLLCAAGITVVLLACGSPSAAAICFGGAIGLVALCFGSIAALVAQVATTSRAANGTAAGIVGAAYLVVALGNLSDTPLGWASPLGWVQRVISPSGPRPLVLCAPLAVAGIVGVVALSVARRRELGAGSARARRSREVRHGMAGLFGRLERTTAVVTCGCATAYGIGAGALVGQFSHLLRQNPQLAQLFERLGGTRVLDDAFTTAFVDLAAVAVGGWLVALVLRLHAEERRGHLEVVLASGARRREVAGGIVASAVAAGVGTVVSFGIGVGAGRALAERHLAPLGAGALAGVVSVPAVLVLGAFALLCAGATRRFSAVGWVAVAWAGLVDVVGPYLGLSHWVLDTSPFVHVPGVPLHGSGWIEPVVLTLLAAVVLATAGVVGFERRELGAT